MNTLLITTTGQGQLFENEAQVLAHYNHHANWYVIKTEESGLRLLFHKSHNTVAGLLETTSAGLVTI